MSSIAPVSLVDQIRLVSVLVDAVAGAVTLGEIYEHALDGLEAVLGIQRSAVLLLDDNHVARFVAWRGLSDDYRQVAEGHFPWPIEMPDPASVAVADVFRDVSLTALYDNFRREKIGSVAFVPLVYDRRLLGKFMLYHAEPHEFSIEELALAQTIGRLIAFAVERSKVETQLRDMDRRKDEFLATLAHELRNPLGALAATLDVIALRNGAGTTREQDTVKRQIRHLSRLIDDLLDLSRISRGLVELRKELVELSTVVARAVEGVRPVLDRQRHELMVSVPARRLVADPVRLEQILANLLGNAAKYTPPGGTITISGTSEPDQVVLRVRDTGIGMPPELLPHVFDLFTQGERSLDRSQGGLGIGLTITKQLVLRHGGTITASSEGPGKGSEFVVTLPAPRPTEPAVPVEPARDRAGTNPGLRVFLVDDNVDIAMALGELIRSWGHTVEIATSGGDALDAIARAIPDVAILDIGLPEIDGYELARRLRAMPHLEAMALIAISGYAQPSEIARSYAAGFVTHLVKPVDTKILRRLLDRMNAPPPEVGAPPSELRSVRRASRA